MLRRPRQQLLLALATLALAALAMPAFAGTLTIRAESVEAAPEAEVVVPITVTGATGMEGLQFVLVFDPVIIENTDVTLAPLAGAGTIDRKVRQPGRIRIAMFPEKTLKEDGVLINARFIVRGEIGNTSLVQLDEARAWTVTDKHPVEMLVAVEHCTVTIGDESLPMMWILAPLILGAMFVVVVLPAAKRKKAAEQASESAGE